MIKIAITSLMILGTLIAPKAKAQTGEADVIQVWLQTRFQNCNSEFADIIHTQFFNQRLLRTLAANECAGAPKIAAPDCIRAVDQALKSKFAMRALREGGCQNNPKFNTDLVSSETPAPTPARANADVACTSKNDYKFTSQVGSKICRQRFSCGSRFTYLGKNFESGTYEFTCAADGNGSCDNLHIGDVSCFHPTIQSIGVIWNGEVQKLTSPAEGAQ